MFFRNNHKNQRKEKQLLSETARKIQIVPYDKLLLRMFTELYERIPTDGHISYLSDNMKSERHYVDEITTYMLRDNPCLKTEYAAFKQALRAHDDEIRETARKQKIQDFDKYLKTKKAVTDVYRRIGNKVIRQALILKKQKREEMESNRKKRYEHHKLGFLLQETARLNAVCEQEAIDCFQEFLDKLDKAR